MSCDRCEARLRRAIGCADMCELLTAAFSFPDEALAIALADGSFASDTALCMEDIGADPLAASVASEALSPLVGRDPAELLDTLKKSYSQLYLAPGAHVPVFPYESAFRFVEEGRSGTPVLFRSPVTLDVEAHFSQAGVAATNACKEPCDSVFAEFAFLSYLFAEQAEAIRLEDGEATSLRSAQISAFLAEHALMWLPSFMERTQELTEGPYAALSLVASCALTALSSGSREGDS